MTSKTEAPPFGVLLIDKPSGPTSHDVVAFVRWALHERAVGHCGTLDPAATGMLVVCIGAATKLVEHLTGVDKRYAAQIVLGRSTTTADAQGETLIERAVPLGLESQVLEVLHAMVGELSLPPPAYSAIKIAGRRAHELARAGEQVDLPARAMAIRSVDSIAIRRDGDRVLIEATFEVGKGTYIRSIAEDLGRRLGVPAHLSGLRRLGCGRLDVDHPQAVSGLIAESLGDSPKGGPRWRIALGAIDPNSESRRADTEAELRARLLAPWTCIPFETHVLAREPIDDVTEPLLARLRQGQRIELDDAARAALGLTDHEGPCALALPSRGELLIARRRAGQLAPDRWIRFEPREAITPLIEPTQRG